MYQIGQKVVYGVHGVCSVGAVEMKTVDRKKISYYVLEPLDQPGARYYIPTENPAALSKLSPLLTRPDLEAMLARAKAAPNCWIPEENQRKLHYRELIGSGDRQALVSMVYALRGHKKQQEAQGKKFHLCDENFLRDAQKLLCAEFSLVLELSREETADFLRKYFEE